ncbi:MAG: hypothetical protein APF76_00405 [Desulfitibacter sp. BRH_c19]|nr:MAG: hypothetical protein APF76_00405 [Desulfitibacter sp. BRH_c19]
MVKVMIVDDHEVVRLGLKGLLSNHPNLNVIGEAASVKEAVSKAFILEPNIILLDVRLPDGSGIEACKEVKKILPGVKIIILTSFPDDDVVIQSILAGAEGFVLKEVKGNSLVEAIEKVARGETLLDPNVTNKVFNYVKNNFPLDEASVALDSLTKQELKVLELVSEGKTNKEIGKELYLSDTTVRNYLSRVMKKLDLSNRAQAAAFYAREEQKK